MIRSVLVLGCMVIASIAVAATSVVGRWRYDVSTTQYVIDPTLAKQMQQDPDAKENAPAMIKLALQRFKSVMAPLRVTFLQGGKFLSSDGHGKPSTGKWVQKGNLINVKFDHSRSPGPKLTLINQGKNIKVSFFGAGFGTTSCTMVRA